MTDEEIIEPFLVRLKERIDSDPDLTPAGLSVKAGLNNAAIRQWFSGNNRSPTIASARKVCAALGTTLEEFMSEARTPEEKEIVRLVLQLPEPLRQELLGYGRGLAVSADRLRRKEAEED